MSAHASAEAEACRQLWVAVLAQGAHDVLAPNPRGTGCKGAAEAVRTSAFGWLRTRDFQQVCALDGVAADTARARIEGLRADLDAGASDWRAVVAGTTAATRGARGPSAPRAAVAGDRVCAVPGCGTVLSAQNGSDVCRRHNHTVGYCRCPACDRGGA
jgi:hypothetical protein